MEQNNECNFSELIQNFLENVKKEILTKTKNNQGDIINNKEIIDSLFNLLNYQITLVHQIFLFRENNKENNDNNSLFNLININRDILVSMVYKFLSNLNSVINKGKNNGKKNYNNTIMNKNKKLFKPGKIINLLYSSGNNNNILVSNSFVQNGSPIKNNLEKEFSSTISVTQNIPFKKIDTMLESEKNSYKFLKNKNNMYNMKNKNNKNIYEKLYNDSSKCDHEEKRKNKALFYHSYSKSMKDIFVDLNTDYINKNLKGKKNLDNKKKRIFD